MPLTTLWSYQYTSDEVQKAAVKDVKTHPYYSKLAITDMEHLKDWYRCGKPTANGKPYTFPTYPDRATEELRYQILQEHLATNLHRAIGCSDKLAEYIIKENHQTGYPYLMSLQEMINCVDRGYYIFESDNASEKTYNRHLEFRLKDDGSVEQTVTTYFYIINDSKNGATYRSDEPIFSIQSTYELFLTKENQFRYSVTNHAINIHQNELYSPEKLSTLSLINVFPNEFIKMISNNPENPFARQAVASDPTLREQFPAVYSKIKRDIIVAIVLTIISTIIFPPLGILIGFLYRNEFKNLYGIVTASTAKSTANHTDNKIIETKQEITGLDDTAKDALNFSYQDPVNLESTDSRKRSASASARNSSDISPASETSNKKDTDNSPHP